MSEHVKPQQQVVLANGSILKIPRWTARVKSGKVIAADLRSSSISEGDPSEGSWEGVPPTLVGWDIERLASQDVFIIRPWEYY
jgi:hypothetical protein